MRILFCMVSVWLCASFAFISEACSSYPHTYLVYNRIKPSPLVRSKPTASYAKYASVQFLSSDTSLSFASDEIDVKTQCAALGYAIPASSCTGIMKPGKACSSEGNMPAGSENYVLGCCNSGLYTVASPSLCADNSTSVNDFCIFRDGGKKYRCKCDRTVYPYNEDDNPCNGDYNQYGVCKAPQMTSAGAAVTKTFYSSCCPSSYKTCEGHKVGEGSFCTVKNGSKYEIRYQNCVCSSSYDTICPGLMIDPTDYCIDEKHSGVRLTRSTNCEGKCTLSRETNIDSYFHGNVWHCLYKDDGATIKSTEGNAEKGICDRVTNNKKEKDYYNECLAQGYTQSESDCSATGVMLRCPSDTGKVWCLDGKYCTGYDVAKKYSTDACYRDSMLANGYNPAKVVFCPSMDSQQGVRCRYVHDMCNKGWKEGKWSYVSGTTEETWETTSEEERKKIDRGFGGKCCNLGFRLSLGRCMAVKCDTSLYPYDDNPGEAAGELEVCYAGTNASSKPVRYGYATHYGYSKCHSDSASGGIWVKDSSNPRKCVCNRKDDVRGWLPFDRSLYFDQNFSAPYGFYEGQYGIQNSCTDAEGSYYGYLSCYIGTKMSEEEKGKCVSSPRKNIPEHPYSQNYKDFARLDEILSSVKMDSTNYFAPMGRVSYPITDKKGDASKVYCINRYTHCVDKSSCQTAEDGTETCTKKLGTDAVCAQAGNCLNGYDEGCNVCYSVKNLLQDKNGKIIKNSSGLYDLHTIFTLKVNTYDNGIANGNDYIDFGFEKCPTNYKGASPKYMGGSRFKKGYGGCFKYCSVTNLNECIAGDVLTEDDKKIGVVYAKANGKIYISGFSSVAMVDYNTAKTNVAKFAPSGYLSGRFGAGKWCLPKREEISMDIITDGGTWPLMSTYAFFGETYIFVNSWTGTEFDANSVYTRDCCQSNVVYLKTDTRNMLPVIILDIATGKNVTGCQTTAG